MQWEQLNYYVMGILHVEIACNQFHHTNLSPEHFV